MAQNIEQGQCEISGLKAYFDSNYYLNVKITLRQFSLKLGDIEEKCIALFVADVKKELF